MIRAWSFALSLCVFAVPSASQTAAPTQTAPTAQTLPSIPDEQLWHHFEKWVAALKPLPPGSTSQGFRPYVDAWVAEGTSPDEATRRSQRVNVLRRASVDREHVYWNAVFKLGGGPSSPLRLLQEAIGKVKPGRSLDAAMGSGRNTIFLAENGWDSHGYDMSEDGVDAAQATAKADGVKISTYLAKHEDFDFGESKWDLIVCSYCFMSPADPHWPSVFLKALKPGGLVVFQVADATAPGWTKVSENWRAFHILRLEDEDPGYIDGDWAPSRTNRTIMLVARKE